MPMPDGEPFEWETTHNPNTAEGRIERAQRWSLGMQDRRRRKGRSGVGPSVWYVVALIVLAWVLGIIVAVLIR